VTRASDQRCAWLGLRSVPGFGWWSVGSIESRWDPRAAVRHGFFSRCANGPGGIKDPRPKHDARCWKIGVMIPPDRPLPPGGSAEPWVSWPALSRDAATCR